MNDYGIKKTQCTYCSHREVCSLKEEFLEAQDAINETVLHREQKDNGTISMIHIRDIKYIEPVELCCKHYMKSAATVR